MTSPVQPAPSVGADVLARQWQRYGDIMSTALRMDPVYTEDQCRECPYGHDCCNLVVSVTPYEALGIMSWLKANIADWRGVLDRVKMRMEAMRAFFTDDSGKPRFHNANDALDAWYRHGVKCVFYDNGKRRCMIYPVRPINCRKAFGMGDCTDETASGIKPMDEDPALRQVRASRVRVGQMEAFGQTSTDLCSMITLLREPDAAIKASPEDQQLMHTAPETLTDEQILWGLGARPMETPWQE